ncbi:MAG TPA: nucleotidyl transferase AbiEii/AbiGii toxin family protein [Candidatus Polarisedimenticolaceae bacterium]|nr:nucleotidyl transferase AbiEii/AbiGii toxin family protein [Candidatus Polarisedimenticolaceae bacterium]
MSGPLEEGFRLDRRWYALRDGVDRSKEPDLSLLAAVLARENTPYAIIGGIALQVYQQEPRTTLDIDVAVQLLGELPRAALVEAGFRESGRYAHSQNWVGPEGTPVQFTDDPALAPAVQRAVGVPLGGLVLRVLARTDLLHEKLRAGSDPARRRSKRLQDLADAQGLLEQDPVLASELTPEERALLDRLPR